MASNLFMGDRAASTALNTIGALFNSGLMVFYASTQPTDANTNTGAANYILGTVPFSSTAFASATGSTLTAGTINASTATSSGICVFYRCITSTGVFGLVDGTVSTAAADLNLNTNNFAQGASISVTSYVLQLPEH